MKNLMLIFIQLIAIGLTAIVWHQGAGWWALLVIAAFFTGAAYQESYHITKGDF